jgi:hypothetical protein
MILTSKYYYAGHSARFMFDTSIDSIITCVREAMDEVLNLSELGKCFSGSRSSSIAVNLLFVPTRSRDPTKRIASEFVSEYVARLFSHYVDETLLSQLTLYCQNHPVMDGWILEMDFLHAIRKSRLGCRIWKRPDHSDTIRTALINLNWISMGFCGCDKDDVPNVSKFKINTWTIPYAYNQGGYDAVGLCQEERSVMDSMNILYRWFRFVQVARSSPSHSLTVHFFRNFAENFNDKLVARGENPILNCEIVILTTGENVWNFQSPDMWDVSEFNTSGELRSGNVSRQYNVTKMIVAFDRSGDT